MESQIETFKKAVHDLVYKFCEKQGLQYFEDTDFPIIFENSNFYFAINDIYYDLVNNIPKGKIIEWYDATLEPGLKINYQTFCKNGYSVFIKKDK